LEDRGFWFENMNEDIIKVMFERDVCINGKRWQQMYIVQQENTGEVMEGNYVVQNLVCLKNCLQK
jgi:hypothetical protein